MDNLRHLQRKLQHSSAGFPPDLLPPKAVETRFAGHVGFPEAADSLAYEPVQSLLAVGTQDGRVKLIGKPGVEVALRSASRAPTKYLSFLKNKGAVLRVTQDGDIQLFSVVEKRLMSSTWLQGDSINAVALLPDDPYVLLGCQSGNVRVVALLDASGDPAAGATLAVDLSLQPYQVLAQDLDASGPVVSLDVVRLRGRPLLVVVHRNSGAIVWDVRAEKIVCAALDDEYEVSKPTSVCWVGERANCFAVGYDDGSILLYGVPKEALQEDPLKVSAPADAQLLMTFRVAPQGARAAPVKSLTFVAGERGDDWLLVLGGQSADEPDMLTKLPLVARAVGKTLPWFGTIRGHALVPAPGALHDNDRPAAVMVLTEGGQLVVHDLAAWQPIPLTLPFQELPPISVAQLVPTVSLALLGMVGAGEGESPFPSPVLPSPASARSTRSAAPPPPPVQHALTLDKLYSASRHGRRGSAGGGSGADAWPLHGGEPAQRWAAALGGESALLAGRHPSALYFTGHRDGRVRVWDATTRVPSLLLALPAAAGQERLRTVTALEVCPFSGIAIVGHQGGEVRLYQFADSQQMVHRMNVDESRVPYDNVAAQPPGFQYVMRYSIHACDITAVTLSTKLKLAAVADESGMVSVLDLMQPALLWSTRALSVPIRHLAVGCHAVPAPGGGRGEGGGSGKERGPAAAEQAPAEVERLVLFIAGADSTLMMLTLEKGEPLEKPLKPKNASRPLAMTLLDAAGAPVPPPQGPMTFPWANNNVAPATALPAFDPSLEEAEASTRRISLAEVPLPSLSPRPAPGVAAASAAGPAQRQGSVGLEGAGRLTPGRAISTEPPESSAGDSLELRELPSDEEVDEPLAAAGAAAAAAPGEAKQSKGRGKFKLPKGFLRPGARRASSVEADLPSPTSPSGVEGGVVASPRPPSSASPSAAVSPQQSLSLDTPGATATESGGPPEVGGLPAQPSAGRVPQLPLDAIGSPTLGLVSPSSTPAPGRRGSTQTGGVDTIDYPYLIDAEPQPAAYLLLCTEDYLRVYSTENVRLGDRSTAKKSSEESPLVFAGVFHSVHGPGVVTIATDGALAVRTVPGLDCLFRLRLDHSNVLGFRWGWGHEPATAAATCTCSADGQLALAGPSNEIARLLVVAGCVEPSAVLSSYDAKLAAAAAAALQAAAAAAAQRSASAEYVVREEPPAPLESAGSGGEAGAGQKKGLGRFFNTVKGTASGALDAASRAAQTAVQATMQELDKGIKSLGGAGGNGGNLAGEGAQVRRRELPTLPVLFATPVEPLEAPDDIDYFTEEEEPAAASPQQSAGVEPSPRGSGAAAGAAAASSSTAAAAGSKTGGGIGAMLRRGDKDSKKKERGELMQGATKRPDFKSGAAHMRTASAVREAYGRPRHTEKTAQVRGIMEENRRMLAERGEKLQDLEQRTAQMQDDASDFASLAKQLEESYANRKWWQL